MQPILNQEFFKRIFFFFFFFGGGGGGDLVEVYSLCVLLL